MKKTIFPTSLILFAMFFLTSCDTKDYDSGKQTKIENTLKSVSLWQDTVGISTQQLFADFEEVNVAIDSIGYPDAGYKIWEVKGDSLNFRFMVEGYWPDQETYELIHNHELYKKAIGVEKASWSGLKNTWYHKFDKVK